MGKTGGSLKVLGVVIVLTAGTAASWSTGAGWTCTGATCLGSTSSTVAGFSALLIARTAGLVVSSKLGP